MIKIIIVKTIFINQSGTVHKQANWSMGNVGVMTIGMTTSYMTYPACRCRIRCRRTCQTYMSCVVYINERQRNGSSGQFKALPSRTTLSEFSLALHAEFYFRFGISCVHTAIQRTFFAFISSKIHVRRVRWRRHLAQRDHTDSAETSRDIGQRCMRNSLWFF